MKSESKTRRATAGRSSGGKRPDELSRHLLALSTMVRLRVRDRVQVRGHKLGVAGGQVIPNLPRTGLSVSELASLLRMSVQRAGQLIRPLEEGGYVKRVPDENDGRAKRVVYTRRGEKLLSDLEEIMDEVTEELAEVVGQRRFAQFCQVLTELDIAVNGADAPLRLLD
jgi:DNA-binding MarR family transcriptional regulator